MVAEWFVLSNNQPVGPYTAEALLELMRQGSILPASRVRRLEEPWITAAEACARLAPQREPARSAAVPQAVPPSFAANSPAHRRKPSVAGHPLVMAVGVVLGGVAALFTYSKIGHLFRPQARVEPEAPPIAFAPPSSSLTAPAYRPEPNLRPEINTSSAVSSPPTGPSNPNTSSFAPMVDPIVPAAPPPNPREAAQAWTARLRDLFQRREAAASRLTALEQRLQPLIQEHAAAEARFQTLFRDAAPVVKSHAELKQKLETLRQLQILARSKSVDTRIADAEKQLVPLEAQKQRLDKEAAANRTRLEALTTELATARNDEPTLFAEVDRLTAELVRHLAPCAPTTPEEAATAREFAAQLVLSASSAGRGWSEFVSACLHARQGAAEAAEAAFGSAIAALPGEAVCLAVRGVCRARVGKVEEALADVETALQAEPKNWTVHYLFALVQCRRGSPAEAEAHLQECLKLQADNTQAHVLLSLLKSAAADAAVRNGQAAQRWAQEAFDLKETSGAHFALAAASAENGNFDDALRHAVQALATAEPQQRPHWEQGVRVFQTRKPLRTAWTTLDFWSNL